MDYKTMTAPCGRDCFNCPLFKAKDNERLKAIVAKKMGIPIEKASCNGCRNENGIIPFLDMIGTCVIYKCINNKGIDFCYECQDFPCDYLHPVADRASQFPHNTKVFNLCLIKNMGLESWAKEKAKNVSSRNSITSVRGD